MKQVQTFKFDPDLIEELKSESGSASKGKIVREEYFHYLVSNGFDKSGVVIWVDYGKYFKVFLKSEYEGA